jgi:hypothetical protein
LREGSQWGWDQEIEWPELSERVDGVGPRKESSEPKGPQEQRPSSIVAVHGEG